MTRRVLHGGLVVLAIFGLASSQGCGGDEPAGDDDASTSSSSSSSSSGQATSSSSSGGSSSSSSGGSSSSSSGDLDAGGLPTSCEGDCRTTTLTVTLGEKSGTFDLVKFGYDDANTLHVEAYHGGELGCPSQDSATPDFTMILTTPKPEDGTPLTRDEGLGVSFLDFSGSIDDTLPPPKVTTATLTPVAGVFSGGSQMFAFDLHAEFAQGAVIDGHGFAEPCSSLDAP